MEILGDKNITHEMIKNKLAQLCQLKSIYSADRFMLFYSPKIKRIAFYQILSALQLDFDHIFRI